MTYDLQLHGLAVELDCSDFLEQKVSVSPFRLLGDAGGVGQIREGAYEVDTDRGDVGLGVGIIGETQQQAGLSHTGVTDEEQLEEVVVSDGRGTSSSAYSRGEKEPGDLVFLCLGYVFWYRGHLDGRIPSGESDSVEKRR